MMKSRCWSEQDNLLYHKANIRYINTFSLIQLTFRKMLRIFGRLTIYYYIIRKDSIRKILRIGLL